MNQLECLTILVDASRQLPETKHLNSALKQADKRIEVLRLRYARMKRARQDRMFIEMANSSFCLGCHTTVILCRCNIESFRMHQRTLVKIAGISHEEAA